MEKIIIKLSNGKIINVEGFCLTPTYSGLLVGEPDEEMNDEILKRTTYPSEWGIRKAIYKQINIKKSKTELKPFIYSAWLTSKPVLDKKNQYNGSSIIIVWFGDNPYNKSIHEIIKFELENIDWNRYAENFNF